MRGVELLNMARDPEEIGGTVTTRLKGQATARDFLIKGSTSSGTQEFNDTGQIVHHHLDRGLADPTIQEQILAMLTGP